jgi:hypothetical protein
MFVRSLIEEALVPRTPVFVLGVHSSRCNFTNEKWIVDGGNDS